ncbi:hypothetical protein [Marinobacter salarius]|uniref:Uncharacterized protein n=1 Tax=Marinobacter salarius TaxID=1420917 RepID=A0A1W6KG03_9GAMM|nr:hypothetical protein [Marinobacter salarius]ARM86356.1 hypothetical protein MARSALSMR5_04339 [Marinobacter salarius]
MPKYNDSENSISLKEQNRIAWGFLFKELRSFLTIALLLGITGYLAFLCSRWIYKNNYVDLAITIVVVVVCVIGLGLALWGRKESIRHKMFSSTTGWLPNSGQPPKDAERVSVEHEDGTKRWNVSVADISWELDQENPIKTYYPKK